MIVVLAIIGYLVAGAITAAIVFRIDALEDCFERDEGWTLWLLMFWPCVPIFALSWLILRTIHRIVKP
jgi:uncharacterized BrkB/YihY/UPF0761 family membrane protein